MTRHLVVRVSTKAFFESCARSSCPKGALELRLLGLWEPPMSVAKTTELQCVFPKRCEE